MAARAKLDSLSGTVAVGRLVLRVGDPRGSELRESGRAEQARPRAGATLLRPRPIRGLVDRQADVAAVMAALDAGVSVEISGGPGVGKTALLRHLAYHDRAASFTHGVVYLPARHDTSLDLAQRLFEAFCETSTPAKPTDAEIRRALHDTHALILLDEVALPPRELQWVLDVAPRCAFIVATGERRLWSEARSLPLEGVPVEDAVVLLERELERPVNAAERSAAASLCEALARQPRRIQQAAALVRERAIPVDEWAQQAAPDSLMPELLASTGERDRRLLLAMSAFTGVPIDVRHLAEIAELTDVENRLLPLVRRGLVLTDEWHGYQLADGVADRLRRTDDLQPWVNRAITCFTAWAERHRRGKEDLLQASEALLRVQAHALDMKRWGEALRLGRLVEGPLVLGLRWGAWGIALERSLVAARAMDDRAIEARVLHELGTRAVCLGDAGAARRALSLAVSLREELGETGAARISRKTLALVASDRPDDAREQRPAARFADIGGFEWLHLREHADAARRAAKLNEASAMVIAFVVCAMLGAVVYLALSGRGIPWRSPAAVPVTPAEAAPSAAAQPSPQTAATTVTAPAAAADTVAPERASIRIFTARPGSIATTRRTDLCYAVSDAARARIEPDVGDVEPVPTLTCRRVAPVRTTTYQLSATGRDGIPVSQQVVIVVR